MSHSINITIGNRYLQKRLKVVALSQRRAPSLRTGRCFALGGRTAETAVWKDAIASITAHRNNERQAAPLASTTIVPRHHP
jgi:hypothetical protein